MFGRIILIGTALAAIAAGIVWGPKYFAGDVTTTDEQAVAEVKSPDEAQQADRLADLFSDPGAEVASAAQGQGLVLDPVVIGNSQVIAPDKEEVPATRDGFVPALLGPILSLERKRRCPRRTSWKGSSAARPRSFAS